MQSGMLQTNPNYPQYLEVNPDTPFVVTVPTTAQQVVQGIQAKWVTSYVIRLRALNGGQYVEVGNAYGQQYQLSTPGQTISWAGNPGEVMNLANIWIASENGTEVIEVISCSLPLAAYGNVATVIQQGTGGQ